MKSSFKSLFELPPIRLRCFKLIIFMLFITLSLSHLKAQSKNSAKVIHDSNSECSKLSGEAQKACYERVRARNTAKFYARQKARKEKFEREEAKRKQKREEEKRRRELEQKRINEEIERNRKESESNRKFIQIKLPGDFESNSDSGENDSGEKYVNQTSENDNGSSNNNESLTSQELAIKAQMIMAENERRMRASADSDFARGDYYSASQKYRALGDSEKEMLSDIGMAGEVISDMFPGRTEADLKRLYELKKSVFSEKITGSFNDGLAPKRNDKGWYGYVDGSGEWIIRAKYIRASEFNNGKATVVSKTGKKFNINTSGKKL